MVGINYGFAGASEPNDNTREPEVTGALTGLMRELEEAEAALGWLLKRLEPVSSNDRPVGEAEPVRGYGASLAAEIGLQANRVASMRLRIQTQLSTLELP